MMKTDTCEVVPHKLDGFPEDFPEREKAMEIYASLFRLLLELKKDDRLDEAIDVGIRMDEWQCKICHGPGPLWEEFIKTIPGFEEYWNDFRQASLDAIKDIKNA